MWYLHWPLVGAALVMRIGVLLPNGTRFTSDAAARELLRICAVIIIYFIAVHVVGTPLPRYSVPVLPFIFFSPASAHARCGAPP
jgi:hypothetical protein